MPQLKTKQTQKQPGVDPLVRRQVAVDIHSEIRTADGIHLFDKGSRQALDEILNNPERKAIYGDYGRGTKDRRKIRNLVQWWKQYTKEEYLKRVYIPYVLNKQEEAKEPDNDCGNFDSDPDCEFELDCEDQEEKSNVKPPNCCVTPSDIPTKIIKPIFYSSPKQDQLLYSSSISLELLHWE